MSRESYRLNKTSKTDLHAVFPASLVPAYTLAKSTNGLFMPQPVIQSLWVTSPLGIMAVSRVNRILLLSATGLTLLLSLNTALSQRLRNLLLQLKGAEERKGDESKRAVSK